MSHYSEIFRKANSVTYININECLNDLSLMQTTHLFILLTENENFIKIQTCIINKKCWENFNGQRFAVFAKP